MGLLKRFVNDRGRIEARGATGTCAQHQRDVATAVKTAPELALLPYVVRTTGSQSRGRRGSERRGNRFASPVGEAPGSETSGPAPETIASAEKADGAVFDEVSGLSQPAPASRVPWLHIRGQPC